MARSPLKIKQPDSQSADYVGIGLSLYPDFTDNVSKASQEGRERIIALFEDEVFIAKCQDQFMQGIEGSIDDWHKDRVHSANVELQLPLGNRMWAYVKRSIDKAEKLYIERLPAQELSDLEKLVFHEPWLISDFIRRCCLLPDGIESNSRSTLEYIYHHNMCELAFLWARCEQPVAHNQLYDFLLLCSTATEWVKRKYDKAIGGRSLHVVIKRDIYDSCGFYLIGLDDKVAEDIRSGRYAHVLDFDLDQIGDVFTYFPASFIAEIFMRPHYETLNDITISTSYIDGNPAKEFLELLNFIRVKKQLPPRISIDPNEIVEAKANCQEIVRLLDKYAREHPGKPIGEIALIGIRNALLYESTGKTMPEKAFLELPKEAPQIYTGLRGPETPPEFVARVYGYWLGNGLDRGHIRVLDPRLYQAIHNWLKRDGNTWPAEVDLPTRQEKNQRLVETLRSNAPDGDISKAVGPFTIREAERIRSADRRRK